MSPSGDLADWSLCGGLTDFSCTFWSTWLVLNEMFWDDKQLCAFVTPLKGSLVSDPGVAEEGTLQMVDVAALLLPCRFFSFFFFFLF